MLYLEVAICYTANFNKRS